MTAMTDAQRGRKKTIDPPPDDPWDFEPSDVMTIRWGGHKRSQTRFAQRRRRREAERARADDGASS